jgi:peptidyl-tRNA hydrolase, PTH1 family
MENIMIVGLGNPGKDGTRHNFGIEAVKLFVERLQEQGKMMSDWQDEAKFEAQVAKVSVQGREVICFFPTTFMNDSGRAVAAYMNFFKLLPQQLVVVHDELELPFGAIEFNEEGGSARGHNGVRSIQEVLGTQAFPRLRLGIGRPEDGTPVDQYVLNTFTDAQKTQRLETLTQATQELLQFTARPSRE